MNFFIYVLLVFNFLILIDSNQQNSKFEKCSRIHSKIVREYFARSLLPIYQKYSVPVPDKCPFSPLNDIYHFHENNKTKFDFNRWKCEICGKLFSSENYLNKHFDTRHKSSLQLNSNSVCLANFCRIFRCDVLMQSELINQQQCYDNIMLNLNNKCKSHVELCIPKGIALSLQNKLTIELRENLCSYLTCSKYKELPPYMSRGPSFIKVFLIVVLIGLSIIAYGVINHTDLIFDENDIVNNTTLLNSIEINNEQQPVYEMNKSDTKITNKKVNDMKNRNNQAFFNYSSNQLRHRHQNLSH